MKNRRNQSFLNFIWCETASAGRNWISYVPQTAATISYVPQTAATTFASASVIVNHKFKPVDKKIVPVQLNISLEGEKIRRTFRGTKKSFRSLKENHPLKWHSLVQILGNLPRVNDGFPLSLLFTMYTIDTFSPLLTCTLSWFIKTALTLLCMCTCCIELSTHHS